MIFGMSGQIKLQSTLSQVTTLGALQSGRLCNTGGGCLEENQENKLKLNWWTYMML